jgi:hypothetical protein
MEERKTMGNQTRPPQAAAPPPGVTPQPQQLNDIGRTTGLSPEDVTLALRRNSRILNGLLIVAVAIIATLSICVLATPGHYFSVSTKDFDTIGQAIYQMFGRA